MIKILILNSKLDPRPYFKSKGINIEVTYKDLNVIVPLERWGEGTDALGNKVTHYAPNAMEAVRDFINPLEYNYVLFCYKVSDYSEVNTTGGTAPSTEVYLGTFLATVRIDGYELDYAIHELHHSFCYRLNSLGYPVSDEMDSTMVNGQRVAYYKNFQREDPDSNHSRTMRNIIPYAKYLDDFPPLLKRGLTSKWVQLLQNKLGYPLYPLLPSTGFFGQHTERCVRDFQKKNGLVADGLVGKNTLKVLYNPTKKKLNLDLSKWNLLPETEEKAKLFLERADTAGYKLKITSGRRTQAEQDKLYAQGRTDKTKPIVTWTRKSNHLTGKAFDIAFIGKDPYPKNFNWEILGKLGESCGLKWGGRWKTPDFPHFEI